MVTTNMFGDILSDEAAMLTGSIGMLPSASLGGKVGMYEPVHGTAPDIAGQDKANPLATILTVAMLLRHSLDQTEAADRIERAVEAVLNGGYRTLDIQEKDCRPVGCMEMGKLVEKRLRRRRDKSLKKEKYNVAVVGATGAVGEQMREVLEEREFPVGELRLLASERSAGQFLPFHGKQIRVDILAEDLLQRNRHRTFLRRRQGERQVRSHSGKCRCSRRR